MHTLSCVKWERQEPPPPPPVFVRCAIEACGYVNVHALCTSTRAWSDSSSGPTAEKHPVLTEIWGFLGGEYEDGCCILGWRKNSSVENRIASASRWSLTEVCSLCVMYVSIWGLDCPISRLSQCPAETFEISGWLLCPLPAVCIRPPVSVSPCNDRW